MADAGPWILTNTTRSDIIAGNSATGSGYKVALVTSSSNISTSSTTWAGVTNEVANGNGYTTGGVAVTLAATGTTSATTLSKRPVLSPEASSVSGPPSSIRPSGSSGTVSSSMYANNKIWINDTPVAGTTLSWLAAP